MWIVKVDLMSSTIHKSGSITKQGFRKLEALFCILSLLMLNKLFHHIGDKIRPAQRVVMKHRYTRFV